MKNINIIITFLFLIYTVSICQIKLAGEQDGVFDSSTYIVSNDLIVPLGKKLEFLPNARLLFLPFTGIKVDGQLKMKNAYLAPKDSVGNWNGIEVGLNGRIHLENVTIHRSVMGVGVHDSSAIQHFSNSTFTGNKSTLRIADSPVFIREAKPYTFGGNELKGQKEENQLFSSDQLPNSGDIKKSSMKSGKLISAITALSCIAVCIYSIDASKDKYAIYRHSEDPKNAQKIKAESLLYRNVAIGTGIGVGVAGITLSLSIALNHKKD